MTTNRITESTIKNLLLITFTGQLFACQEAFQYRLFPIGQRINTIIAIETSLNRYWGPDTVGATTVGKDRWEGTVALISLSKQGKYELINIIDTVDILDIDYCKELNSYFDSAIHSASKLAGFEIAPNPSIEFCNYKKDCQTIDLINSTVEKLAVKDENENKYEIKFPKVITEYSTLSGGMENQEFKINSIRKMTIGKSELIIINFASGEEHNTNFDREIKNQKQCTSIKKSIYKEITLYHGLAFDAIIFK